MSARLARSSPVCDHATPRPAPAFPVPIDAGLVPPEAAAAAASPALALQRELSDALLSGWGAPRQAAPRRISGRHIAAVVACAAASWAALFAAGWALLA